MALGEGNGRGGRIAALRRVASGLRGHAGLPEREAHADLEDVHVDHGIRRRGRAVRSAPRPLRRHEPRRLVPDPAREGRRRVLRPAAAAAREWLHCAA